MDYLTGFDWRSCPTKLLQGRLYFHAPEHPLAGKTPTSPCFGNVNLARHIASVERGKWLDRHELIFFKDGNVNNLDPDNLLVVRRGHHYGNRIHIKADLVKFVCPVCKKVIFLTAARAKDRVTDSLECRAILRRKFDPTFEELYTLIWVHPQRDVGKMFGVKPENVAKRCEKLGIPRPPLGYWRILELGGSREKALIRLGWRPDAIAALEEKLSVIQETVLV